MPWPLLLALLWAGSLAQDEECELHVPKSVTVQEGLCILLPCNFSCPNSRFSSVFGYWFRAGANTDRDSPVATNNPDRSVQEETQVRFHLLRHLQNKNCSLSIMDAQRCDNGSYFFRLEKGRFRWNYRRQQVFVHVTALNHTPDLLFSGTLESGRSSNLTCSVPWACERGTPPIFSWMSGALTSLGPRTRHSSMLTLTPRPQDHGTNLICQVKFPAAGVTVERTIQLDLPWNRGSKALADVVRGGLWGAGITALLAVGLCLVFFIMKTHRRRSARTAVDMGVHPAIRPATLSDQQKPKLQSPTEPSSSPGAAPTEGTEEELHYASLNFHGMNA